MLFTSPSGGAPNTPPGNAVKGFFASPDLLNKDHQDQDLFVDSTTGKAITIRQYYRLVPRSAAILRNKYHVLEGDVVGIFGVNHLYTPNIHHATLSLGATVSPANIMYSAEELAHQFKTAMPKVCFTFDPVEKTALEAARIADSGTKIVKFSEIFAEFERVLNDDNAEEVAPVDVDSNTAHAYYCFSSGTSGLPKGVITTHHNILANTLQTIYSNSRYVLREYDQSCVLPMSHIFGLNTGVWSGPYAGKKTVIFPKFDMEDFVSKCVKYKLKLLYLVPPIVLGLGKLPVLDKYPEFGETVEMIISGAAPISKETISLLTSKCPKIKVSQGYGLTETTPITHTGLTEGVGQYDTAAIGWLVPGAEAKLVNPETGKEVDGYEEAGELWLRGPMVMAGYLHNQKATDEVMTSDGFFKTGDVAKVSKSQQFYIVDRIKELIKSNGHQVAPAELESILLTNPHVNDAAVIGVYNEDKTSEMPRAYIVVAKDADVSEIVSWFNKRVAKHKRLWGGAVVLDAVPKSASGKILRKDLRARAPEDKNVIYGKEVASL